MATAVEVIMQKDKHPKYKKVLFVDSSTGRKFLCGAAMDSKEQQEFEGAVYPVCRVPITSDSHPLFTGDRNRYADTEGRVKKFENRYVKVAEKLKKA